MQKSKPAARDTKRQTNRGTAKREKKEDIDRYQTYNTCAITKNKHRNRQRNRNTHTHQHSLQTRMHKEPRPMELKSVLC